MALIDKLTAIANAIRAKDGTSGKMTLAEMPNKIAAIQTGITPTGSIEITENGTYDVTDKASAVVNVAGSGGATEKKGLVIDEVDDDGLPTKVSFYANIHGEIPFALFSKVADSESSLFKQGGRAWINLSNVSVYNVTTIQGCAFSKCSKLTTINGIESVNSISANAFESCTNLILGELPPKIKTIEGYAFYNCTNLSIAEFPYTVGEIKAYAFWKCLGLTSITFKGKPKTIASTAFTSCTNLTTINVPWAEGAVAGAPWGATNATINYNYTGG